MICVFVCDLILKTPAKITTFLWLGGPFASHMFSMHCSMSNARVPWINAFVGDPPLPLAYRRRCLCAHSLPPLSHSNNNCYSCVRIKKLYKNIVFFFLIRFCRLPRVRRRRKIVVTIVLLCCGRRVESTRTRVHMCVCVCVHVCIHTTLLQ